MRPCPPILGLHRHAATLSSLEEDLKRDAYKKYIYIYTYICTYPYVYIYISPFGDKKYISNIIWKSSRLWKNIMEIWLVYHGKDVAMIGSWVVYYGKIMDM